MNKNMPIRDALARMTPSPGILAGLVLFFKPGCFYFLSDYGQSNLSYYWATILNYIYEVALIVISGVYLLRLFQDVGSRKYSLPFIGLLLIRLASGIYNGELLSFDFYSSLIRICEYCALVGFLVYWSKKSFPQLINSCVIYFSLYVFGALLSIVLTANQGFISDRAIAGRIFLFGGKNSIINCFLLCIVSVVWLEMYRGKIVGLAPIVLSAISVLFSRIVDSSSSMFFLLLLTAVLILMRLVGRRIYGLSSRQGLVCLLAIAVCPLVCFVLIVVLQADVPLIKELLALFGRNELFSGRTYLWSDAVRIIKDNPVLGSGDNFLFTLSQWTQTDQAHSFYLTVFARYGFFYFLLFMSAYMLTCFQTRRNVRILSNGLLPAMFLYVMHSLFDDMNVFIYVFISTIIFINAYTAEKAEGIHT